jgi:hypothetical protein
LESSEAEPYDPDPDNSLINDMQDTEDSSAAENLVSVDDYIDIQPI